MEGTAKHAKGAKTGPGQIVFKEESFRITGACFEVYKEKGNGFLEAGYQECLGIELVEQHIPFEEKPRLRVECRGQPLGQACEPDFLCFGEIILEIKAVETLTDEHRAQVINYLKATGKPLGLLVNFGRCPRDRERAIREPVLLVWCPGSTYSPARASAATGIARDGSGTPIPGRSGR